MKPGDSVIIHLKEVRDGIDQSIQGRRGIIESCNADIRQNFDFCVRIGSFLFGLNETDLDVITEDKGVTQWL